MAREKIGINWLEQGHPFQGEGHLPRLGALAPRREQSHVEKDRRKIRGGRKLSPLLLVRDEARGRLIIADGYHRLCAAYYFDEDALIPCKIA